MGKNILQLVQTPKSRYAELQRLKAAERDFSKRHIVIHTLRDIERIGSKEARDLAQLLATYAFNDGWKSK